MQKLSLIPKFLYLLSSCYLVALIYGENPAQATTQTTNMNIAANVNTKCFISSVNHINFGNYDPIIANTVVPVDALGGVSIGCTKGTNNATIALDYGSNANNHIRRMKNISDNQEFLTYELYSNTDRNIIWDTTNKVSIPTTTTKNAQNFIIYARLPAGQDIKAGTYNDTIQITLTY